MTEDLTHFLTVPFGDDTYYRILDWCAVNLTKTEWRWSVCDEGFDLYFRDQETFLLVKLAVLGK